MKRTTRQETKNMCMRIISLCTALILSAGLLVGCRGNSSDKDEQGRTVISVGGWPSKEGTKLDNKNAQKARFEEANQDVVIKPDFWSFDRRTFYAKAEGDQLPTVFQAGFTEAAEIISSEYSADLTDILKERGYADEFDAKILDAITDDEGNIMVFPNSCYVLGLAFNTEIMEEAGLMQADGTPKQPKTWEEVAEFAVTIKEKTGKPGFIVASSNKYGGWLFTPIAWSYGVDFMEMDSDGKWIATFNTPECVKALQFIKDLKWKYDVLPSNTLVDGTEFNKLFATGGAGMIISAGTVAKTVTQYGMLPEQLGMMALPAGPKRHVTLLGGNISSINRNATEDQIDAAVRWIETLYSFKLTDEYKENTIKTIEEQLEANQLVGIKDMSVWSSKSEALDYTRKKIEEMSNCNMNHVKLYNDFVANCPAEIQPEEPVCAQELYEVLDGCIQEVLVNKDADCSKLIDKAAKDFQANYLDNL